MSKSSAEVRIQLLSSTEDLRCHSFIFRHETLIKPNIRQKLFHFQPSSLTAETLWINLSLKRTLQKRKWALYSFIHLINRLLAWTWRPLHKSRAPWGGSTPAHASDFAMSPKRISLQLFPHQQDAPSSLFVFPPCPNVFFPSHGQKAEQSKLSLLLLHESVKWLMTLPSGFPFWITLLLQNTIWSHLRHQR